MYLHSLKGKLVFGVGFLIGFIITIFVSSSVKDDCDADTSECRRKLSRSYLDDYKPHFRSEKWIIRGIKFSNENIRVDQSNITPTKDNEKLRYQRWLENNNIIISQINMDAEQYQNPEDNKTSSVILESAWLKRTVNIVCVVFVEDIRLARAIKNTWSRRCNEAYFFSHKIKDNNVPVIKLALNITSSWQMLCEAMHYAWKLSNEILEWTIFIKDNMMVLPENLRYLVAPLDFNDDYYMGHPIIWWGQTYNVAQAGYVLSRSAFRKIIERFNTHDKCAASGKYWRKEDYYLGKHLASLNIHPFDTRDHKLRGTFHGYSLQTLLWNSASLGNYFTRALYPTGSFCCSPRSIAFCIDEPDKMHTTNYLLYHLYVYNVESCYGNKPAPTPVPEHEIWKLALKEEFNISDVDNITSERYYAIWRSKYSKPLQFINEMYKINVSQVIDSIMSAHGSAKKPWDLSFTPQ